MISRNTKQKKIIMDALACADHPTATELYGVVREIHPNISRGTVFRVLAQFAEKGSVLKLNGADGSARFDARTFPHAHACCSRCGRVYDVFDGEVSALLRKKEIGGFCVDFAELTFTGICENCKGGD